MSVDEVNKPAALGHAKSPAVVMLSGSKFVGACAVIAGALFIGGPFL